jgi:hypothetical protein
MEAAARAALCNFDSLRAFSKQPWNVERMQSENCGARGAGIVGYEEVPAEVGGRETPALRRAMDLTIQVGPCASRREPGQTVFSRCLSSTATYRAPPRVPAPPRAE